MEKQYNYDNNNALTEVSLALAMAFFSIMILSIFAVSQSSILKNQPKLEIKDKNNIPPEKIKSEDTLIYYHDNIFYDKDFNDVNLKKYHEKSNKIILSVSPKISLENLFKIKKKFKNLNVKITQHDEKLFNSMISKRGQK